MGHRVRAAGIVLAISAMAACSEGGGPVNEAPLDHPVLYEVLDRLDCLDSYEEGIVDDEPWHEIGGCEFRGGVQILIPGGDPDRTRSVFAERFSPPPEFLSGPGYLIAAEAGHTPTIAAAAKKLGARDESSELPHPWCRQGRALVTSFYEFVHGPHPLVTDVELELRTYKRFAGLLDEIGGANRGDSTLAKSVRAAGDDAHKHVRILRSSDPGRIDNTETGWGIWEAFDDIDIACEGD